MTKFLTQNGRGIIRSSLLYPSPKGSTMLHSLYFISYTDLIKSQDQYVGKSSTHSVSKKSKIDFLVFDENFRLVV